MLKMDRKARTQGGAAHALRALIHAEMAHERAGHDEHRAAALEAEVREALERHRQLTGAEA